MGILAWERIRKETEAKPKQASGIDLRNACAAGDTIKVNDLLKAGAGHEVQDLFGRRPLHYAAETGVRTIVRAIVNAGADVSVQDRTGDTALHKAALLGRAEAVMVLLLAGAPAHVTNVEGQTAAEVAQHKKQTHPNTTVATRLELM